MSKRLLLFLLLAPLSLMAQTAITGKVISMASNQPIPNASVFLSNTSIGTSTGTDGTFTLVNAKNGQYDLVVSCIGYEPSHQTILYNGAPLQLNDIKLMPKVTELKEVKVKYDANRDNYVRMFTNEFFGATDNAKQCRLLNPELLDLDYNKSAQTLKATTDDYLVVENKALGYIIHYQVSNFLDNYRSRMLYYEGAVRFEPMKGSKSDERRWKKKRLETYLGSDVHFLRACISGQVEQEGFTVRRLIHKANPARPPQALIDAKLAYFRKSTDGHYILFSDSLSYWSEKQRLPPSMDMLIKTPLTLKDYYKTTEKPGIYAFGCTDCLYIRYKNNDLETTTVTFNNGWSFFDSNGIILNPQSCVNDGAWGQARIANMLPVDYEPGS